MIYDEFLTHVLPSVDGCPDATALDAIKKAGREFCARTMCWDSTPSPLVTTAGIDTYGLDLPDDAELVKLLEVVLNGTAIPVETINRGRSMRKRSLNACFAYVEDRADLVLAPAPTLAGELWVQMAMKPALAAETFPDELVEYVTDIAHGAIASLCALPRKTWTDLKQSQLHAMLFNARVGVVAMKVANGHARSPAKRPHRFL